MAPRLVAIAGPIRGETLPLAEGAVTIGREPSNHLHPPDLSLSRSHSVLVTDQGLVTITDLESVNGTFVNGVPIKTRVLEHGDQVKVGESVFVFATHATARATLVATSLAREARPVSSAAWLLSWAPGSRLQTVAGWVEERGAAPRAPSSGAAPAGCGLGTGASRSTWNRASAERGQTL